MKRAIRNSSTCAAKHQQLAETITRFVKTVHHTANIRGQVVTEGDAELLLNLLCLPCYVEHRIHKCTIDSLLDSIAVRPMTNAEKKAFGRDQDKEGPFVAKSK